jgi:hypothetical protein
MVAPSIEGTYQLVRRELPDGTVQLPPAVMGMITYTKEFRSFSVVWKDNEGRFYSECYVARYTLTDKEYAETSEYLIVNDQIGGKGINYDLSNTTAKFPGVHRRGMHPVCSAAAFREGAVHHRGIWRSQTEGNWKRPVHRLLGEGFIGTSSSCRSVDALSSKPQLPVTAEFHPSFAPNHSCVAQVACEVSRREAFERKRRLYF